ncbi:MAG: Tim44/TimA family putative adaptor protein [Pseudomonadota bacterium]
MEFLDLTTVITIAIAVFILLRLRSVLGQRTGHQKPEDFFDRMSKRDASAEDEAGTDNVVKLPRRDGDGNVEVEEKNQKVAEIDQIAKPRTKLNKGLKEILSADANFSPKEFLGGANMAYEMIVNAFADGDKRSLRNLLSSEVFSGFESVINDRANNGETVKSSFVGIDSSKIRNAELSDNNANVTVRFESQIVSATYDKDNNLIDGDENEVVRVTDIWTFSRNTQSRDPNWKLVATEAEG